MIHKHMSIPEFLNELDLEQLRMVINMSKDKIEKITDQEKVVVWVFSSGVVNEGFRLSRCRLISTYRLT